MDVDPKKEICGIKPALLKELFRKDWFDTPTAMRALRLAEPEITHRLRDLERLGWVAFEDQKGSVDRWKPGELGTRLTATRLQKRISHVEGHRILELLLEEVRKVNDEENSSCRIQSVLLFGSLLTGLAGDTVGDIDVVVKTERRHLPEVELGALEASERASAPHHMNGLGALYWADTLIRRRLKKVSRYLSLHPESDIHATAARCQEVYGFDMARECEVPADRRTKVTEAEGSREPSTSHLNARPERKSRSWPADPTRGVSIHIGQDDALLAQHLFMNGVKLAAIAERLRLPPEVVQAYLSSRRHIVIPGDWDVSTSLKSRILGSLPQSRDYTVHVEVRLEAGQKLVVDVKVEASTGRIDGKLRRVGRAFRINGSLACFAPVLEILDQTAADWFDDIRSMVRGLGIEVAVQCDPTESRREVAHGAVLDLRPLRSPMVELLKQLLKSGRDEIEAWSERLTVKLGAEPVIIYSERPNVPKPRAVRGAAGQSVYERAAAIYSSNPAAVDEGSWSVFVTGRDLFHERNR